MTFYKNSNSMGIFFNMVKEYTFLFKGGKIMDNFEKIEKEKLKEVSGGKECIRLEKHKCINAEAHFGHTLETMTVTHIVMNVVTKVKFMK